MNPTIQHHFFITLSTMGFVLFCSNKANRLRFCGEDASGKGPVSRNFRSKVRAARETCMYDQQKPLKSLATLHSSQALVPVTPDRSDSSMQSFSPQVITPTMAPLYMEELESRESPPMSDMEKAVKALVNFDDINETIVTPERRKAQEKKMQLKPKESTALPPTAPEWYLGSKAALGDIKKHTPPKVPAKEIMITHANSQELELERRQ
jgi:hypothetical protein